MPHPEACAALFAGLVALVLLQGACVTRPVAALAAAHAAKHGEQQSSSKAGGAPLWYFYNEVTGEVQFDDPGDTAYEDETGVRYWYLANGQRVTEDPNRQKYLWCERPPPFPATCVMHAGLATSWLGIIIIIMCTHFSRCGLNPHPPTP